MRSIALFLAGVLTTAIGVLLAAYLEPQTEFAVSFEGPKDVPGGLGANVSDGMGDFRPAAGVVTVNIRNKGPQLARNVEASVFVVMGYHDSEKKLEFCRLLDQPRVQSFKILGTGESQPVVIRHRMLREADPSFVGHVHVCIRRDGLLPFNKQFTRVSVQASGLTMSDQTKRALGVDEQKRVKELGQPEIWMETQRFFSDLSCATWWNRNSFPVCRPDPISGITIEPEASVRFTEEDWMPNRRWLDLDNDCQDGRQETLIAQSRVQPVLAEDRCSVRAGRWVDAYTGADITDPRETEIDHLVSLREANESGGFGWPGERKRAFAQDISTGNVFVVATSTNRTKQDREPGEWQPNDWPRGCWYMRRWLEVKRKWRLSMDAKEVETIRSLLEWCDSKELTDSAVTGPKVVEARSSR